MALTPSTVAAAPAPVRRHPGPTPEQREARAKASIGVQRTLDPMSEEAIAARGGAADTMEGNIAARDAAVLKQQQAADTTDKTG